MKDNNYLIGLTGNIATGKSVVRRMLENSGALGLDADLIAHRLLYKGTDVYRKVIQTFGKQILTVDGQISRKALGDIVFHDASRLKALEALMHPAVEEAIMQIIDSTSQRLIVIEAIKLIEAGLNQHCDALWVSHISESQQLKRLINSRGMDIDTAQMRIDVQPPQKEKRQLANVVIHTEGSFKSTWLQIQNALDDTIDLPGCQKKDRKTLQNNWQMAVPGNLSIKSLEAILQKGAVPSDDLYQQLGTVNVAISRHARQQLEAAIFWQNWDFTGTLQDCLPEDFIRDYPEITQQAFMASARLQKCELLLWPDMPLGLQQNKDEDSEAPEWQSEQPLPYPAWAAAYRKLAQRGKNNIHYHILSQPLSEM
jgi:dephospho-CoA kinase